MTTRPDQTRTEQSRAEQSRAGQASEQINKISLMGHEGSTPPTDFCDIIFSPIFNIFKFIPIQTFRQDVVAVSHMIKSTKYRQHVAFAMLRLRFFVFDYLSTAALLTLQFFPPNFLQLSYQPYLATQVDYLTTLL